MTNRAADNLAQLDAETARLLDTVAGLGPDDVRRPSRCPGWTLAHVLTHLSRNADALLNLVRWAADGRERAAYPSALVRDAQIEDGALRPLEEIVVDLRLSAERFRRESEVLTGPAGEAQVRSRTGTPVTGAQLVSMRLLEVVFHHVDLDSGYGFEDADPGWVARTLRRGARQWDAAGAPGMTLRPEGMAEIEVGGGGPALAASPARLLLWLARGVDDGLALEGGQPLPQPPPWS
ncbi:maleylpyruvate isomerase family mycothiol-dependent enzyme [Ornithinimicrobium avium]|uniref:Maleylpyruvate isomerase family mycothiol-dependent enzyme n=1 Tax=Ornithinimicrobium avium TaxID=2283195 RepID=A0A345NP85_9MICO|nr:maleylpyruvate isomerase family mycothiol-dependent enzyme [Ornithinimicrobium avium]AXH96843.1 maleylpyruvate isomerase family mycothiol-dependent enzyme [Ornithinimicrobium avium]